MVDCLLTNKFVTVRCLQLLAGILLPAPLVFSSTSVYAGSIRSNCIEEWKTNYRMIEYCIKKQSNAYSEVNRIPNNQIKESCSKEWGENYRMIKYCYEKQSGAKERLGMDSDSPSRNYQPSGSSVPERGGSGCITVGSQTQCF